jgi:hypothetical protein
MTVTVGASGEFSGGATGHALAIEFCAPTVVEGLARAVEGFADALGEIHPSMVTERHTFRVAASTPAAMLLALLEECLRCHREGRYVVGLVDAAVTGDVLQAGIDTVPADDPHVHVTLPPVISWHEVSLDSDGSGGWSGRIVAR